jgi:hypothetical protein
MSGIVDIEELLKEMEPVLEDREYVFCTKKVFSIDEEILSLNPIGTFLEKEGMTFIISKDKADKKSLSYESVFYKITLNVHSSLDAVGLTAAISTALKEANISANVIAGFYHDHIFIPKDRSHEALKVLIGLTK